MCPVKKKYLSFGFFHRLHEFRIDFSVPNHFLAVDFAADVPYLGNVALAELHENIGPCSNSLRFQGFKRCRKEHLPRKNTF